MKVPLKPPPGCATEITILVENLIRAKQRLVLARCELELAERLYNEAMRPPRTQALQCLPGRA